jgi:glycolate oxidase
MMMKRGNAHSIPLELESQHSLFLLGQKPSSAPFTKRYRQLSEQCARLGEFLSIESSFEWLSCYERDAQSLHAKLPVLVFRPHAIANIAPFLKVCHQMALPVTTRCGGTGLAGSCVPGAEGVVLLTGHFKQIRGYDPKKGRLSMEPGVTVRQLNSFVEREGWIFPLSMATEGVAGIAGSLSCHARGYHQQQFMMTDLIEQVTLVDGTGEMLEAPASLVCGAEGSLGVIIEIRVSLKKRPVECQEWVYSGSWQDILAQLPFFRSLYTLSSIVCFQDHFYLRFEGESWRMSSTLAAVRERLPDVHSSKLSFEYIREAFQPSCQTFLTVSAVFNPMQLQEACRWSLYQAQQFKLDCIQQIDVLAGSLHLILESREPVYSFSQKMEHYLAHWTNYVASHDGALDGAGRLMTRFKIPFWTEESLISWRNLQRQFDPKR